MLRLGDAWSSLTAKHLPLLCTHFPSLRAHVLYEATGFIYHVPLAWLESFRMYLVFYLPFSNACDYNISRCCGIWYAPSAPPPFAVIIIPPLIFPRRHIAPDMRPTITATECLPDLWKRPPPPPPPRRRHVHRRNAVHTLDATLALPLEGSQVLRICVAMPSSVPYWACLIASRLYIFICLAGRFR